MSGSAASGDPVSSDPVSGDATHPPPAPRPPAEHPGERAARRRLAGLGALLLTGTALPAAVLTVPDATAGVLPAAMGDLGLGDAGASRLLHVTGLSLPALLLAVPPAAAAARRFPAWAVLATGLALLLAGLGAARAAPSLPLIGLARTVQGAGAGIVLPASLVLVWEHRDRRLTATWAGVLAGMLVLAMPLALVTAPGPAAGEAWRTALAPFPWFALVAVSAALLRPLLRGRVPWALPAGGYGERSLLLLPLAPAAGFGFLAVAAAREWSPGARVVLAGLAVPALLGLAAAAGRRAPAGSPHGCAIAMIAVGLLGYPVAAPLAGIAAAHTRGDGVPVLPFAAGAAAALAGALAATRAPARGAVPAGFLLLILALPLGVAAGAGAGPGGQWALLAPLLPLGAGAGLALAASLRGAAPGAALFGLSLCFPAALAGQLCVLSLQASRLDRARPATGAGQVRALLAGYHDWLIAAGMAAVLLAAATAALTARRRNAASGPRAG
ncbi:hypothetical protein HUT06_31565 [Actinomadura sp. NAK00032]|uniref:hypothetical protein n=1 Tax=Actinomadura sp. NAK00032 TaxID=2742128 RepID=UPI00158FEF0F|nr:hypothetical protein [Actinomadura sp. NAK00032]QKW37983.1 hypothetical protein HUT06_31565 [Actinomadura sp. NAK00032]